MNHLLRRNGLLLQKSSHLALPWKCVRVEECIGSPSHSGVEAFRNLHIRFSSSGFEVSPSIKHPHVTSSPCVTGAGVNSSLSFRHIPTILSLCKLGLWREGLRCMRHVHTTASRKGAVSNLKEASVDSSDDNDPPKSGDNNPSDHNVSELRSTPSAKILQLVKEIANLTLLDASDLSYLLKKKLGLPDFGMPYYGGSMGANAGGGAVAAPSPEEEKKPEKTNFDVKLEKFDAAAKIKVIKEVRTFTSLGLKEAKELVEKLPAILKKGVAKEEAEQIIEKLKAFGATVVLE